MDTFAYDHGLPCKNPMCRSHGIPHPNCRCWTGSGLEDTGHLAHGGQIVCSGPHREDCTYHPGKMPFYADGGHVLGHAAVQHGLLGLMKNVGGSRLQEPERHKKVLEDIQAQPVVEGEPLRQTMGVKLGTHLKGAQHEKASDLMHGHPLVGGASKSHLKDIMGHLGSGLMTQDPSPDGMRSSVDYLHSAARGEDALDQELSQFLGAKDPGEIKPRDKEREALKTHLESIKENPSQLLDIGGSLGHYMPDHAAALGAATATAVQYLDALKPKSQQLAPLDMVVSPDKASMATYDRQLDIAQHPLLAVQHMRDGTLQPQDVKTIGTIYPKLLSSMQGKAFESLVEAKTKGVEIPYKQKQSLSLFLGQPLDSTMTPQSMQAIIKSQGGQQAQRQMAQSAPKKATGVELKQINQTDSLSQTPLEKRQIDQK